MKTLPKIISAVVISLITFGLATATLILYPHRDWTPVISVYEDAFTMETAHMDDTEERHMWKKYCGLLSEIRNQERYEFKAKGDYSMHDDTLIYGLMEMFCMHQSMFEREHWQLVQANGRLDTTSKAKQYLDSMVH